jgi:hypothetical protein
MTFADGPPGPVVVPTLAYTAGSEGTRGALIRRGILEVGKERRFTRRRITQKGRGKGVEWEGAGEQRKRRHPGAGARGRGIVGACGIVRGRDHPLHGVVDAEHDITPPQRHGYMWSGRGVEVAVDGDGRDTNGAHDCVELSMEAAAVEVVVEEEEFRSGTRSRTHAAEEGGVSRACAGGERRQEAWGEECPELGNPEDPGSHRKACSSPCPGSPCLGTWTGPLPRLGRHDTSPSCAGWRDHRQTSRCHWHPQGRGAGGGGVDPRR